MRSAAQSFAMALVGAIVGLLLCVGAVGAVELARHPLLRFAADQSIKQDVETFVSR